MMTLEEAGDTELNEREAALVGHPAGTLFKDLPGDALRVLATWYLQDHLEENFIGKYYGQFSCGNWEVFYAYRYKILWLLMGETFDAIEAEKAEWIRLCAEADAKERALSPCTTCGRSRTLAAFNKEGLCGECASEEWRREHPFEAEEEEDDEDLPF